MFKRLFWLMVGFGFGIGLSMLTFRWFQRTLDRFAPPQVADRVTSSFRTLGRDLHDAVVEGRSAMRDREAALRTELAIAKPPGGSAPNGDG